MQPSAAPALPQEHMIQTGSLMLHFATWGTPTPAGRALLLIHGLTASSRAFADLGPALAARGWYVIAPDLRGRGLSAKPAHGYSIAHHANDLLTLCDQLSLQTVHVVGHSLGGIIGLYLAAVYPQRVGKLAVIDIGGRIPEDTQQAIAASVNRLGAVFPSLDAYLAAMSQLPVIHWNPLWEAYFRYDAEIRLDGTVTSRVPKHAIEEEQAALVLLRAEDLPPFVRQPTLLLRATLGTLAPDRGLLLPREEAERMRAIMPNCRVVEVPDTNHYTIVLSDVLTQALLQFLAE